MVEFPTFHYFVTDKVTWKIFYTGVRAAKMLFISNISSTELEKKIL